MGRAARRVTALAALLALAGCSQAPPSGPSGPGEPSEPTAASPTAESPTEATTTERAIRYVALGDSYAAAPGLLPFDDAEDALVCLRSQRNYAHLLADADPRLRLVDRSCSGATSDDVVAEQLDALDDRTDLVTVGAGGNDSELFSRMLGACTVAEPESVTGSPCTDADGAGLRRLLPQVEERVGAMLDAVLAAAPQADVVVVGYPSLLPRTGSETGSGTGAAGCPDRLPIPAGDLALVRAVNDGLSEALRRQAAARDLAFADLAAASRGHDVCAAAPWVAGATFDPSGAIPFHPTPPGQEAVAALVVEAAGL